MAGTWFGLTELIIGREIIEMVPPKPEAGIELADTVAASTRESCTGATPRGAPGAMLNVAVARLPSPITSLFSPQKTHSMVPLLLEHVSRLFAAVVLAPAAMVMAETAEGG